jgi:hypothetical protein
MAAACRIARREEFKDRELFCERKYERNAASQNLEALINQMSNVLFCATIEKLFSRLSY